MLMMEMTIVADKLLENNPNTANKLHKLGYDDKKMVAKKLKEIKRSQYGSKGLL